MNLKLIFVLSAIASFACLVFCDDDDDDDFDLDDLLDEYDGDDLDVDISDLLNKDKRTVGLSPLAMEIIRQLPLPEKHFSFSCYGRYFGYYADLESQCRYFHICHKLESNGGVLGQFSFLCPNETVFDQDRIECREPKDAFPCEKSTGLFHLNKMFAFNGDNGDLEDYIENLRKL